MRRFALVLLALAACSKQAVDLTPFPCARDNTCPDGVACLPRVGCVKPQVDVLCKADADCAAVGSAACDSGRCGTTCKDGTGCPAGRICSASSGDGVCLADCSAGETCPSDLSCNALFSGGKRGCLPAGVGRGETCSSPGAACGPRGAGGLCDLGRCEASCRDGAGCSAGSICTASKGTGICLQDCGAGQACSGGLTCNSLWDGRKACLPATVGLDLACSLPGAQCGPVGTASICDQGRCGIACKDGAGCIAGRVCSAAAGDGICLVDCTAGQTCPSGTACNGPWAGAKKYCVASGTGIDSTCTTAGASCGPRGSAAICDLGRCALSCKDNAGCQSGRACSAATGDGVCLVDCTAGASCATGTSCNGPWGNGKKYCIADGAGVGSSCASAAAVCAPKGLTAACDTLLGSCLTTCQAGAGCPAGSICSSSTAAGVCFQDCTAGQTCGSPLECGDLFGTGKKACLPKGHAQDSPCATEGAACGPSGYGATCRLGVCELPCSGGGGCATGRTCSATRRRPA